MDRVKLSQILTGKLPYENITKDNAVVVIGKADFGPSMIPIEAVSLEQVEKTFGPGSRLTNAYNEYRQTGIGTVYLLKINGTPAETTIQSEGVDKLTLVAIDCSESGNFISYNIESFQGIRYLEIIEDGTKYAYTINNKTIGQVVDEINRDAYLSLCPVYAISHSDDENTDCLLDCIDTSLVGGDSEIYFEPEYAYDKIEECLNNLLPIKFSQLAVIEGDTLKETLGRGYLYTLLTEFAKDRVLLAQPCIITIGCDSGYPENVLLQELYDFASNMGNITNIEYSPSEYINIMVAKLSINGMPEDYVSDGIMSYCALISNARLEKSLTNEILLSARKNLLNLNIDGFEKTHDQFIKELSNFGYVTFINDSAGNVRVFKSVNMLYGTQGVYYKDYAEYTKPQSLCYLLNVLLLQRLSIELNEQLEPLLGQQINESAISSVAENVFSTYKNSIKEYKISVNKIDDYRRLDDGGNTFQTVKGYTRTYEIAFDIVPYGEIESLSFALSLW